MTTFFHEPRGVPEPGIGSEETGELKREIEVLRARLSGLSEATLRISEDLDPGAVLQGTIDSARALTGARYGALLILDPLGGIENLITSGITSEETMAIKVEPKGLGLLGFLNEIEEPLRLRDLAGHPRSIGFPEGHPPMRSFLGTPIFHRGERLGNIYLTEKELGREFTTEDEETITLFASHAAMAISNARRYTEETRAKADLEALVDTSPVGVLVFDARKLSLVSFNQETLRITRGMRGLGRSREELLSALSFRRPDGQEIPPDDLPTTRAIRSGDTVRAEEIVIELPDGQRVHTIVNATPVFSEGEIVSVIVTLQDMTPLERLERLRSEFIGMVSDELRTPLAAIKGSAATMLSASSAFDQSEMRHFFQVIDEQADRMRSLIGDLLDTAQIEAGRLSIDTEPADAADLLEEARREFLRGGATNVIEIDLPPVLPQVEMDRQRMMQVLNNLFTYASIYSPYGSTIRVSAAADDLYVSISVVDEGKGVSAEDLSHLFRKFYPLNPRDGHEAAAARKPGSTALTAGEGLSLVVCKGIVEGHGGRIWAESGGPGLGTRFTFTIPSVEEQGDGPAADSGRLPADPGQERILAVDNEPRTLLHLRRTLQEAGYTPIVTGNLKEAERLIETNKPHLVLLDPGTDGADMADMMDDVRGLTDAPVIFMSGQADDEGSAIAFDMGADDYILKPFSPTELVARVKAALRRQSAPERTQAHRPYLAGDLEIDYSERRVTVAGRPVQLTSTEYRLLFDLSTNAGRVMTHDQLLRRVWGPGYEGDTQPVRTHVKNLRRKLKDDPKKPTYIFTEPRVGYRMVKPGDVGM